MKLVELHVFQRQALTPDDSNAITGERVSVGCRLEDLAESAGREDDRFALEHVQIAGGEFVRDDPSRLLHAIHLVHDHV